MKKTLLYLLGIALFLHAFALHAGVNKNDVKEQVLSSDPLISGTVTEQVDKGKIFSYLNDMPVAFRKNVGQWDSKILYKGHTRGWDAGIAFLKNEISYRFLRETDQQSSSISPGSTTGGLQALIWNLRFKNSNNQVTVDGGVGSPSIYNYIRSTGTYLNVPDHPYVKYQNIYNNIDIAYYLDGDKLKHDFVVHPTGTIGDLQLECRGINSLSINPAGELEINTAWGTLIEKMPESYQLIENKKVPVQIHYVLLNDSTYGFQINGNYSVNHSIVIDPIVMDWCTFLTSKTKALMGGNNYAHGIDVDGAGFAYVTGFINEDFDPTPGSYGTAFNGPTPNTILGNDVFVVKMNQAGSAFVYATYVGGTDGADRAHDIRVKGGVAYVTGLTESSNFPTTAGAYDASFNGNGDAFMFMLNAAGTALVYSTIFGGSGVDNPYGIDVDGSGSVYISGNTYSNNMPTKSAYDATFNAGINDAFAVKFNPAGGGAADLIYSTYIGGNGYDRGTECAVNAAGELHITGVTASTNFPIQSAAFGTNSGGNHDAFVTKLNAAGNGLIFSTYLGGTGDEYILPVNGFNGPSYGAEYGGIAVASTGDVFVVGTTGSADFPVTAGAYSTTLTGVMDVFVAKLTSTGSLSNATFIGAPTYESRGFGIDLNSNNEPFVSGMTFNGFPTTSCSFDPSFNSAAGYQSDFFLAKFNNNLSTLVYSTFIGGSEFDYNSPKIALIDKECYEEVYMCGTVHSKSGFPTTAGAYQPVHQYSNGADEPAAWKFKPEITVDFTTSATLECNTPINFFGTANGTCIWQAGAWVASGWEWNFGDGSTSTLQNPTHTYSGPGTYSVTLKVECPTDSIVKQLIIIPNQTCQCSLTAATTPVNATCGNANGNANVTTNGAVAPETYSWSTVPPQTTQNATGLNTGTYTVLVTDANNCTVIATVQITNTPGPTISITNTPVKCNSSNDGTANANVSGGTGVLTYSWSSVPSQNTAAATGLIAGAYTVLVTDVNGCTITSTVLLTEPTQVTLSTSQVDPMCGQNDGSATVIPAGGTPGYTYTWTTNPVQNSATAANLIAGGYTVTVADANGCTTTISVTLTTANAPTGTITTIDVKCFGGNDGSATVNPSGGTAPLSYTWNTAPVQNGVTATGLIDGIYIVTITDATGCSNTVSATILEPTVLDPAVNTPEIICIGQSTDVTATVAGGTPAYTYNWNNGQANTATYNVTPLINTTYTVEITDANGCTTSKTVTVNVNPPLSVVALQNDSVCPGGSKPISATASGGNGNYSYNWMPGNLNGPKHTVTPGTTTEYTVTVTDDCGTPSVTATVTIKVLTPPVPVFTGSDTTGCMPWCVDFKNNTPNSADCAWDFSIGTEDNCNPHFCFDKPGKYSVSLTVTDNNGCVGKSTHVDMVEVYPLPNADFVVSPQPASIWDTHISFTDQSTGAALWYWQFGDGDSLSNTTANPTHTYPEETTGTYMATLTVYNQYGCKDDATKPVVFQPDWTFYIPNTFTPNGDGKNDYFIGMGLGIQEYEMWIFDRWGNQIYHCTSLYDPWDGKVQDGGSNDIVQEDTYVWLVFLKDVFLKNHRYIGHVNVVK